MPTVFTVFGSVNSLKERISELKERRSHWTSNKNTSNLPAGNISAIVPRSKNVSDIHAHASTCIVKQSAQSTTKSISKIYSILRSPSTEETASNPEWNRALVEGHPSLSEVGIPDNFEGKIGKRSSKFFYGLPYVKRLILLRRTENMTVTSTEFGQSLAEELDLPFQSVASWLSRKRYKNLRILQNPSLTPAKMALLQELFQYSKELNEEGALLLSYELELPVRTISDWFEREKEKTIQPVYCTSNNEELLSAKVTPNELPVFSDDDPCSPIENEFMDISGDENDKFVFSEKLSTKIVKYRNKFFYRLPYSKQIALLKKSRYLTMNQTKLARKLARRLDLPYENVSSWLSRKRYRNLRMLQSSKLTEEQELFLEDEFQLSQELNDERALMLGYELVIPTDKLQEWFKCRKDYAEKKP